MGQIRLFGTLWDTENIDDGYYTYDDAIALAKANGKRLPTAEEWGKLSECPRAVEYLNGPTSSSGMIRGMWFAEKVEDLKNPEKSLFLPAKGIYLDGTETLKNEAPFFNFDGHYWAFDPTTLNSSSAEALISFLERNVAILH
jgi:hypothetical protein